jgi:hypothetical protein
VTRFGGVVDLGMASMSSSTGLAAPTRTTTTKATEKVQSHGEWSNLGVSDVAGRHWDYPV